MSSFHNRVQQLAQESLRNCHHDLSTARARVLAVDFCACKPNASTGTCATKRNRNANDDSYRRRDVRLTRPRVRSLSQSESKNQTNTRSELELQVTFFPFSAPSPSTPVVSPGQNVSPAPTVSPLSREYVSGVTSPETSPTPPIQSNRGTPDSEHPVIYPWMKKAHSGQAQGEFKVYHGFNVLYFPDSGPPDIVLRPP